MLITKINKLFNQIKFYTIIEPDYFIAQSSYKNLIRNIFYYLYKDFNLKKSIKNFLHLILKGFLDFFSLIYLPIILIIYFSKFRFLQLDYSQIGIFSHQLNGMCKYHFLKNKIPIICIPKTVARSHIKKIFHKLIVIDSIFLNIIFLPFINSKLISCPPDYVESFYKNAELDRTTTDVSFCKIIKDYHSIKKSNYFELSESYSQDMKKYFEKNFQNFDIKNTFVLHSRDAGFVKNTSDMRNSNIRNYLSSIDMILKNYNVIRFVHSNSEKLKFSNNYSELDVEDIKNQFFQYYLLSNCRGFICAHSGPGPLGALLNTPILELNLFPLEMSYALKENDLYVPKKIIYDNKKFLHYREIFGSKIRFFNSPRQYANRNLKFVENTEDEIFEAVKEFIDIQNKKPIGLSENKIRFKKSIPSESSFSLIAGSIPDYFLKKNYNLFF